ncbi:MAG: hypothetical protein LIO92_13035 [Clostridiales bacterium]|nr:hypothetical protein [Clostridiales bacterium]
MSEKNTLHRDCEPHDAENCDINEHSNLEPGADDCGHYVAEGPGTKAAADLNEYTKKYGDKVVIAGATPKHNLDQDVEHGPGVQ